MERSKLFWPASSVPHDFCFIVDGERYYAHKIVVFSISPKMLREAKNLRDEGKTLNEYELKDIKDPFHYFTIVIDYFHGKKDFEKEINRQNAPFLVKIGHELEIENLVNAAANFIEPAATPENCIEQLNLFSSCFVDNYPCAEIIANNWEIYSHDKRVFDLSVFAFEQIFDSSPKVNSESELFEYIERLIEAHGKSYAKLFSVLNTIDLDSDEIDKMIEYTECDEIDTDVIEAFKERLCLPVCNDEEEDYDA